MIPDGLHEVGVACDLRGDDGEGVPLVADEDAQHGGGLVVNGGGQLDPEPRLCRLQGREKERERGIERGGKVESGWEFVRVWMDGGAAGVKWRGKEKTLSRKRKRWKERNFM